MNYELSLLLFAAARGAKAQYMANGNWLDVSGFPAKIDCEDIWRVHPKDERLLWGPISGKYWEMAGEEPDSAIHDDALSDYLAHQLCVDDWISFNILCDDDKRTYLMLLACALQGEGL